MERNTGKGMTGQQKNYDQIRYSSVETRAEGLGSANQRFFQDPSSSINTNIRPPDFGIPVGARPVLNFSIQTGEEFALEFMRDRVNPRQQFLPNNSSAEHNVGSSYMDLKGILGISSTGSESGSEIARMATGEQSQVQGHGKNNLPADEGQVFYQPVPSVTLTSSRNNYAGVPGSSGTSDSSSEKLKFLCSFGGKILPRPSDGKLRYVGGETRIVRMRKNISWMELLQKTLAIYSLTRAIKYQLPGEDLDALVSVSSDEDLQNMMEECNVLEGGSQKLRMFLFSSSDLDDSQVGLGSTEVDSEVQYVVAVNGMDFGSRRNSIAFASTSVNNLDELLGLSVERESNRVAADLGGTGTSPVINGIPSSGQSSQSMEQNVSRPPESNSHNFPGKLVHGEADWNLSPNFQQGENFPNIDGKSMVPSSAKLGSDRPNYPAIVENSALHLGQGRISRQGGLVEEQSYGSLHAPDSNVLATEVNLNRDSSIKKKNEFIKDQSADNDVLPQEMKMKRESSNQKLNEPEKMQLSGSKNIASSSPCDTYASKLMSKDETPVTSAAEHVAPAVIPSTTDERNQLTAQKSMFSEFVKEEKLDNFHQDGHFHVSVKTSTDGFSELDTYPTESSYEPPVIPQRPFRSERLPREQAGLNRLSKSDDSSGAQFLMHSQSDVSQQVSESVDHLHERSENANESVDKMRERSVTSKTEEVSSSGKPMHQNLPNDKPEGSEKVVEAVDNVNVQKSSSCKKPLDSKAVGPDKETSGLTHPATSQGISGKILNESASRVVELPLGEIAPKRMDGSTKKVQILPTVGREHPVVTFAEEKPSASVATPERADILIDINDRFPPDFLHDIFSQAKDTDGPSRFGQLTHDGNGLSLNMENHEPKHWSFFQKLAQDDFVRKDVSLMDQDHLGFSTCANVGEVTSLEYGYPPSKEVRVANSHADSHVNFDADIQQQSHGYSESANMHLPSDYNPSQVTSIQSMQFHVPTNSRRPEADYQDAKIESEPTGFPLIDLSLGDFDPNSLQIIKNEDLEELRELGSGTFGTVYHGKWRGTDVAIKRIKKSCFTGRSSEQERLTVEFWREAEILSKLHHPNVVAFYGVVQDGPGGTLATVTEFMVNGSLRHVLLSKDRHLDRRKRLIIAMDAAFGMEYLHSKNIVHFDLKCDNLLVNLKDPSRPICKVGDFGLSKIKRNTLVTGGVRGTLPWMAPELLNGSSSKVSEKVDVFSFGIVLWEILTGEEPYANMHYGAIIGGIVNNTLRPPVPSFCDPDWRLLMEQCWAPDPSVRPCFTEIARRLRLMSTAVPARPQGYAKQNQISK
ncbi:hypothetical protein M9H77_17312 [Catharanthus roseus]|uniref:Uncharacterized protein n=1 Tax=Catharanthus roseus TaxID=4058 RepID=A0ACC0B485_CATRO|nr:hypothetical protein M9H77_17312 [Catharanthus roseus]